MVGFGFGLALSHLRSGQAVRRQSWSKGDALVLVPASLIAVARGRPLGEALPRLIGEEVAYSSHLDKVRVNETTGEIRVESWSPSHEALMAEDWEVAQ